MSSHRAVSSSFTGKRKTPPLLPRLRMPPRSAVPFDMPAFVVPVDDDYLASLDVFARDVRREMERRRVGGASPLPPDKWVGVGSPPSPPPMVSATTAPRRAVQFSKSWTTEVVPLARTSTCSPSSSSSVSSMDVGANTPAPLEPPPAPSGPSPPAAPPTLVACRAAPLPPSSSAKTLDAVLSHCYDLSGEHIDPDAPLLESGLDSIGAVELGNQLQEVLRSLLCPPTPHAHAEPSATATAATATAAAAGALQGWGGATVDADL